MHLPPLQPISNLETCVSGDVTIDPSAAIAPGVILQAEPNSRIAIAAGVCIGMGVILHAREGILEIEAGVTLGAGVLIVGKGKIGANACIGSATTILDHSIQPGQVVPPASLIGDTGRQIPLNPVTQETNTPPAQSLPTPAPAAEPEELAQPQSTPESPPATKTQVYGQAHLNSILLSLFPHGNSLRPPPQDNPSNIGGS